MKIRIPTDLRKFQFDGVCPVTLNGFEIDVLMPALFYRVVTLGKVRGRRANDPEVIDKYVAALAAHDDLLGFDGGPKLRLLDRLVRTGLIEVGAAGRSHQRQQIEGLKGYNLLTFKPGFPVQSSRVRRVDVLLYRMLTSRLGGAIETRKFFQSIFGKGITLETHSEPGGYYDGITELDTLTRLSLAFIDTFESAGIRNVNEREFSDPLPSVSEGMSRDLLRYMKTYNTRMPIEAFTYHLKVLVRIELFVYTMKLFRAIVELASNPHNLPDAMEAKAQHSGPDIYFDFWPANKGLSRELARYCVRRDLEILQAFIPANIRLLVLDRYCERAPSRRLQEVVDQVIVRNGSGAEYLQSLLIAQDNSQLGPQISARALNDEDQIVTENLSTNFSDNPDALEAEIKRITRNGDTALDRLVLLIANGLTPKVSDNLGQWYRTVGGVSDTSGILKGTPHVRQSWRYAPSNDVLATLVQLAAVDYKGWSFDDPKPQPISLQGFLIWLEERFGILVDQPPDDLAGAEYAAAAKENLRWMLRRLKQMGIFRDLSDDLTVQRLTPPYMNARTEQVQL